MPPENTNKTPLNDRWMRWIIVIVFLAGGAYAMLFAHEKRLGSVETTTKQHGEDIAGMVQKLTLTYDAVLRIENKMPKK